MDEKARNELSWSDFTKVEMRIGTILEAEVFQEAKSRV